MNLYIPEIGDQIVLAKDWSFALHPERRNTDLAAYFGYYFKYDNPNNLWIDENILPKMKEPDYKVNYPSQGNYGRYSIILGASTKYEDYQKECKEAEQACPEFVKYWADHKQWNEKAKEVGMETLDVALPAGTILGIDRIYIRKGAKDYSSITFFAKNLGSVMVDVSRWSTRKKKTITKKAMRFWVKLEDANNIEFDFAK